MSLERWCPCGRPADGHGSCHDCDADRAFPVALNQVEAELFAEDYATRAALGERLERGGLDVPRGER